jgi:hypothetical protein
MDEMEIKQLNGACTIASPNYLPYVRTLAQSYREQHPGDLFSVLVVADIHDKTVFDQELFEVVFLDEIGLTNIPALAMKYDILELNTNVKPTFMKFLLRQARLEKLIYLDPDIRVYCPLLEIYDLLESNNVVLTPHITSPVPGNNIPSEQEFLQSGTYNLGFIAVRRSPTTDALLNWWEARCLEQGFNERQTGLFVDQKWINLAPALFDGVAQCKHPGCNIAYWNLHDRVVSHAGVRYLVNETYDLCFYHFSGVVVDDPTSLSKYTNSQTLESRPDLGQIFDEYKREVILHRCASTDNIPYGFDQFEDGTAVTKLARRMFAAHETQFSGDPFRENGRFFSFANSKNLIKGKPQKKTKGLREFNPKERRVQAVNRLLSLTLSMLGPYRYELLMKYLAHISILRNQGVFISNGRKDC